jgi:dipeptidyl aminopeptidase/acylaminoacyl peptidase
MRLVTPELRSARCYGLIAAAPRGPSAIGRRRSGGRASLPMAGASLSPSTARSRSIFSDTSDGGGSATLLVDGFESPSPLGWSPDGRKLLFRQIGATTGQDVWVYSADDRASMPILQTTANELSAAFSPDGRWVAYVSDESGRVEVYVPPFPGPGPRTQVSVDGGTAPVWSRGGGELFFCERGHALCGTGRPRRNIHERRGPTSVLRTVRFRRGHRELRRGS